MEQYDKLHQDIQAGRVISAYALDRHGIAAAVSKMAFGNGMGVKIEHSLDPRDFFAPAFGDIICEVPDGKVGELAITYTVIGEATDDAKFSYGDTEITLKEALSTWEGTLENVFKTAAGTEDVKADDGSFTKQTASMYANIKWQNHAYSFRYSLEQTASTTALVHLREQALK